jgi:Xaa-Pro dipeptidase
MLKPGTVVADLYRIHVDYLRNRGIEPTLKFLGHGIGQTIHEEPYISDTRTVVLQPNITCTMEPLYMIPGHMGFHVEDMYRIMPNGFEAITSAITPNDPADRGGLIFASPRLLLARGITRCRTVCK